MNPMPPQVSIIIPVYNSENTLRRCLDSVLAQTFTDFECLLINDGSKDRSGEICDEYARKDSRVKVFHKENGGVSSARNVGLDNASGGWITFSDSDDTVTDEWLQNAASICAGKELVVQGFYPSNPEGFTTLGKFEMCELPVGRGLSYLCKSSALGYVWNKMFLRRIISEQNIRFCNDLKFKEDEVFLLQYCGYICRIQFSDKQGYYYNVPDWKNKYRAKEDFERSYLLYEASLAISWGDEDALRDELFRNVTGCLFNSYKYGRTHGDNELRRYKALCGNKLLKLPELSVITKLIYLLPVRLSHKLLLLKQGH